MRILLANPFGIGDILFSFPLASALRQADPGGHLAFLCNRRTEALVRIWPMLDQVFVFEKDEFRASWKQSRHKAIQQIRNLMRSIRTSRFDALVDLSLGWHYSLGGLLAEIPRRIGFDYRKRGRFLTQRIALSGSQEQSMAQSYLDLLPLLGFQAIPLDSIPGLPLPDALQEEADRILQAQGLEGKNPLIGMVPGGGISWGPNARFKQWAPARFAQVGSDLIQNHSASLLLIGDHRERELCEQIASRLPPAHVRVLSPQSLAVLAGILKRCTLVVGNDSGPMHLAEIVGTRTVSIFGPVDGSVYGPFLQRALHRVVSKGLACRPCYRQFRFPACSWDNACLKQLESASVVHAVEELIK